jgi:hypothetical protein
MPAAARLLRVRTVAHAAGEYDIVGDAQLRANHTGLQGGLVRGASSAAANGGLSLRYAPYEPTDFTESVV